jgi:hypothetical protein
MTYPPPIDDPERRRIAVGAIAPAERTPSDMLLALRSIVNRQVAALEAVAKANDGWLPDEWDDVMDRLMDRVCKLARADLAREPTDDELLDEHDREHGGAE